MDYTHNYVTALLTTTNLRNYTTDELKNYENEFKMKMIIKIGVFGTKLISWKPLSAK